MTEMRIHRAGDMSRDVFAFSPRVIVQFVAAIDDDRIVDVRR
jgi:hypothetical protein